MMKHSPLTKENGMFKLPEFWKTDWKGRSFLIKHKPTVRVTYQLHPRTANSPSTRPNPSYDHKRNKSGVCCHLMTVSKTINTQIWRTTDATYMVFQELLDTNEILTWHPRTTEVVVVIKYSSYMCASH